jgi:hypothetical protein
MEEEILHQCFSCNRSEMEYPLVNLRHAGHQNWVCTQCLPTLIHHPQELASRLVQTQETDTASPED